LVGGEIEYSGYAIGISTHLGTTSPIDIMKVSTIQDLSYSHSASQGITNYTLSLFQKGALELGDELSIAFKPMGIDTRNRIVGIEWNPFNYKEVSVTIGDYIPTLNDSLYQLISDVEDIRNTTAKYTMEFGELVGNGSFYFTRSYLDRPYFHTHTNDGSEGTVILTRQNDSETGAFIGATLSGVKSDTVTLMVFYCTVPAEDESTVFPDDDGEPDTPPEREEWLLTHRWDLTANLTDTVGGQVATRSGCTLTPNGLQFTASVQSCSFGSVWGPDRAIEIDCGAMTSHSNTSVHLRTFMIYANSQGKTEGLVWRHQTQHWAFYHDGAWEADLDITDRDYFSGKTVRFEADAQGYVTLYANGSVVGKSTKPMTTQTDFSLGGYADSFYQAIFREVRVYERNGG
ncbi:MAG: phage tail protein, partial [Lachnospiraceae bacterium]|nr:phage tail protein [Lachnospiraceae bacterium]